MKMSDTQPRMCVGECEICCHFQNFVHFYGMVQIW